jgi:hypothetical protein
VEDTPWVVGTLTLTERGVRVALPYIAHEDQFKTVSEWIEGKTPPENLSVHTNDLQMSLFGLRYGGDSQNLTHGTAQGFIDVEEALMRQRDGNLHDPLLVEEVQSEIDGLIEWSRLSSVTSTFNSTGEGRTLRNTINYTLDGVEGLSWKQGDATLTISNSWQTRRSRGIQIDDRGVLVSTFDEPRPFKDHLAEQRKLVALLSLIFGTTIAFRNHQIRDSRFAQKAMDGTVHGFPHVELISRQTVRDYASEKPSDEDLRFPLIRMSDLTPETLKKWGESYESLARFLLPVVGLLRVRNLFVENAVINATMSLEAFGKDIVTLVDGEKVTYWRNRPTTATYILRGIKTLSLPWESIAASEVGLARAIANNYNSIKHPDRGDFPDSFHTQILGQIATGIARLNTLKLVASEGEYVKVDTETIFRNPIELFKLNNLFIGADGVIGDRELKSKQGEPMITT